MVLYCKLNVSIDMVLYKIMLVQLLIVLVY